MAQLFCQIHLFLDITDYRSARMALQLHNIIITNDRTHLTKLLDDIKSESKDFLEARRGFDAKHYISTTYPINSNEATVWQQVADIFRPKPKPPPLKLMAIKEHGQPFYKWFT